MLSMENRVESKSSTARARESGKSPGRPACHEIPSAGSCAVKVMASTVLASLEQRSSMTLSHNCSTDSSAPASTIFRRLCYCASCVNAAMTAALRSLKTTCDRFVQLICKHQSFASKRRQDSNFRSTSSSFGDALRGCVRLRPSSAIRGIRSSNLRTTNAKRESPTLNARSFISEGYRNNCYVTIPRPLCFAGMPMAKPPSSTSALSRFY